MVALQEKARAKALALFQLSRPESYARTTIVFERRSYTVRWSRSTRAYAWPRPRNASEKTKPIARPTDWPPVGINPVRKSIVLSERIRMASVLPVNAIDIVM